MLLAAALFAFGLAIFRACSQAITLDEATTYFWWASGSTYSPFFPSSNNHVLNSLLMWLSTHAFGVSSLAVRLPALLGAILYISICYFLCQSLTGRFSLQLPVFLCLIYNPFILDFMVAARGYGLANAFLLAAITIPLWHHQTPGASLSKSCALASLALGLSFTANFSFAFVDAAVFLAIAIWSLRTRGNDSNLRIIGFCVLPGFSVALLICGYPLTHWPGGELWYGAHSLQEMERSLIEPSLHQLNPRFHDSGWYKAIHPLRAHLLPYAGILCIAQLVVAALDGSFLKQSNQRWLAGFAAALAAVVVVTILLHWFAFRFDNLPLPKARTGIFLLPIFTLIAAAIAASPARSLISHYCLIVLRGRLFPAVPPSKLLRGISVGPRREGCLRGSSRIEPHLGRDRRGRQRFVSRPAEFLSGRFRPRNIPRIFPDIRRGSSFSRQTRLCHGSDVSPTVHRRGKTESDLPRQIHRRCCGGQTCCPVAASGRTALRASNARNILYIDRIYR
jgi:hypothetical protein